MSTIEIPGQHVFYVRWSCRKCGHTNGVAKTTIPLPKDSLTPDVVRNLFEALKQKLPKVHQRQGCIASIEDFRIERGRTEDAVLVGLV
jgi:hypothetical protein